MFNPADYFQKRYYTDPDFHQRIRKKSKEYYYAVTKPRKIAEKLSRKIYCKTCGININHRDAHAIYCVSCSIKSYNEVHRKAAYKYYKKHLTE